MLQAAVGVHGKRSDAGRASWWIDGRQRKVGGGGDGRGWRHSNAG